MYEFSDKQSKRGKSLLPTSGIDFVKDFNVNGAFRSGFVFKGNVYTVVGASVFLFNENLIPNLIGTLNTEIGQVDIDANTFQVMFVDGVDGWIWDTVANTFTKIVGNGFPAKPLGLAFLDGYFIVGIGETNQFILSALNNGMIWNNFLSPAPNVASITSHPGNVTALKTLHRRLFIFSNVFCEVWENAGLSDFPLRRNNSLLMEFGTISKASVVSAFDRLLFLSNTRDGFGHVMMVVGSEAIPVSPQALDNELQTYSTLTDAFAFCNQDNGIVFYRLNFTTQNQTWVFNVSQSSLSDLRWHQESLINFDRHLGQIGIFFNEFNYMGSYKDAKLYEFGSQFLTNNGEPIIRERITKQYYDASNNKIRVDRLYLDIFQGEAPPNSFYPGTDADPLVMLEISRDGGRTYRAVLSAKMGKMGLRTPRTIFRKLGVSKTFTFRIRCYNAVKFVLLGASIDSELLPE